MNWFLNIILIFTLVVLQTTIIPELSVNMGMANIIFVVFITLLFFRFYDLSLIWASMGGLFLDFVSSTPSGVYFFGFLIIYLILTVFFKVLDFKEFIVLLIIIFLTSILFDLFAILYLNMSGYGLSFSIFYTIIISSSILNVILVLILYPILTYINNHIGSSNDKTISLSGLYK